MMNMMIRQCLCKGQVFSFLCKYCANNIYFVLLSTQFNLVKIINDCYCVHV